MKEESNWTYCAAWTEIRERRNQIGESFLGCNLLIYYLISKVLCWANYLSANAYKYFNAEVMRVKEM